MQTITIADGQLPTTAGVLVAGTTYSDDKIQISCVNTGVVSETIIITFSRSGGTSRQIVRAILVAKETLLITGLAIASGDSVSGVTTTASTVDYVVSGASAGQFNIQTRDANGAIRHVNSGYVRTGYTTQIATRAKVGAGAGWVVAAADNLPYVGTMAASQTAGTLILPVTGLHIGDTITAFKIVSQIESAGGIATLDADLRAVTNVAAEPTDASIGTITQVSVTADTASAAEKTGLTEIVTSGKSYYIKITGTTAAATDIILQHAEITVSTS